MRLISLWIRVASVEDLQCSNSEWVQFCWRSELECIPSKRDAHGEERPCFREPLFRFQTFSEPGYCLHGNSPNLARFKDDQAGDPEPWIWKNSPLRRSTPADPSIRVDTPRGEGLQILDFASNFQKRIRIFTLKRGSAYFKWVILCQLNQWPPY